MALPPGAMTREQIEELVALKVKKQKGGVLLRLRYRASHPDILTVTVSPHIQKPHIYYYRDEGDLVKHIQRHEASIIGRTNVDNHFLFLATLGGIASHWFFGLLKASVRSWRDLKDTFIA